MTTKINVNCLKIKRLSASQKDVHSVLVVTPIKPTVNDNQM